VRFGAVVKLAPATRIISRLFVVAGASLTTAPTRDRETLFRIGASPSRYAYAM
jgi:hypothetical protein